MSTKLTGTNVPVTEPLPTVMVSRMPMICDTICCSGSRSTSTAAPGWPAATDVTEPLSAGPGLTFVTLAESEKLWVPYGFHDTPPGLSSDVLYSCGTP